MQQKPFSATNAHTEITAFWLKSIRLLRKSIFVIVRCFFRTGAKFEESCSCEHGNPGKFGESAAPLRANPDRGPALHALPTIKRIRIPGILKWFLSASSGRI
jgi:hypothetical protein